ncbi:Benzyl alcohol O-benzoyltransferase [Hibiscus syriacus]|uniref:Benzyl alcohol O-benzoyltransferase n=1 Tax=Hibiscus syriacus TaxID=106335 RepID=A0A6A2XTP6_HIBSY|nr:Benzyl alcohol O-benzoyltransferase [Hibiscus syriacus]
MALLQPVSLVFTVRRQEPELVVPTKPTPHESCKERIKALVKALVFYYPFAGRLKEGPNRKLKVDCTGEGVLFVEADADVTLEDFGDSLHPPFPCLDELLSKPPGSNDLLNCPVLQIQLLRDISDNLCCSTFDVLTACIWRCRTIALELGPDEDVRFICIVNARSKFNPPLPLGYYGNVLGYPAAQTTARELSQNPLEFAVKLVKKAKAKVTDEYMKLTADLLVTRGRPNVNTVRSLIVSDLTRVRLREVDFGRGKAEFGGPVNGREIISFYIWKNKEGKEGIAVPVCLPAPVMESFAKEINRMLTDAGKATSA